VQFLGAPFRRHASVSAPLPRRPCLGAHCLSAPVSALLSRRPCLGARISALLSRRPYIPPCLAARFPKRAPYARLPYSWYCERLLYRQNSTSRVTVVTNCGLSSTTLVGCNAVRGSGPQVRLLLAHLNHDKLEAPSISGPGSLAG
jgi:predicted small secreted protein